ncbi:AN1-like Zinc finger containing protein [Novymonas esmeraldas]|uniref:AN1-like Zinc finger containing protein n=1 Tax=Novymonas esmeraldas TaxID=1808958 RepID=A0AAW0EV30_9TRYP
MEVGVYDGDEQMCQHDGCTEIDLLPARCSHCHKRFCSYHLAHSAHHCTAVTDVRVGTCPICLRIVPLEYPRQRVDEAVSRHIDRNCRDVPQRGGGSSNNNTSISHRGSRVGATATTTTTTTLRPGQSGGQRLGGSVRPCSLHDCHDASATRVKCEQCGQVFCLQHRGPLQHQCRAAAPRISAAATPPQQSATTSAAALGGATASVARLLTHPANTPAKAVGKATELPSDMVTCLVCFLIPAAASPAKEGGDTFEAVPSFFMYMPKGTALGRVLDTAVDKAAMTSAAVRTGRPWHLFGVTLPLHVEAESAYYPPLPLSTTVGKSAIGVAERSVAFVSPLPSLPDAVMEAVREVERSGALPSATSSSSSNPGCHIM